MKKYALIMIDMQRGFIDPSSPLCIPCAAGTVPACAEAIDLCHDAGVPVIFAVRHYRADGIDVEKCRHDVWLEGGQPLSEGDIATFTDIDGNVFIYKMVERETLNPTDIEGMESGNWDLTLFTCTVGGQSRVTIRFELEED